MKVIEALKFSRDTIWNAYLLGVNGSDVKYIPLYDEYMRMLADGCKVVYTVAVLAEKYGITQRSVYSVIKRLDRECEVLGYGKEIQP